MTEAPTTQVQRRLKGESAPDSVSESRDARSNSPPPKCAGIPTDFSSHHP
jgi:hypothetical protein